MIRDCFLQLIIINIIIIIIFFNCLVKLWIGTKVDLGGRGPVRDPRQLLQLFSGIQVNHVVTETGSTSF